HDALTIYFVWRKSSERYHKELIKKSNQLYDTLLQEEIIPVMERENLEELSVNELEKVKQKVDKVVDKYDSKIIISEDPQERKKLRSERKFPRQVQKQVDNFIERKQKYLQDFKILDRKSTRLNSSHVSISY